jgi:HEAT repeat protein
MTTTPLEPETERQLAIAFVAELIISRRVIQSYPESHPAITAKLEKVTERLAPLVAGGRTVTFGITREGLMLNRELLETHTAKFMEYANLLASFGIIALSFSGAVQPEEFRGFNRIVSTPRNEIWSTGGIHAALADAGISSIKAQAIDPSVFILTDQMGDESEDEQADPWDIFVRKLLQGYFSIPRERLLQLLAAPPEDLAREFDTILFGVPEEVRRQTLKALADFFAGLAEMRGISALQEETLDKICAFITGLSPEMRTDFIINICRSATTTTGFSEQLIPKLPGEDLLRVMESIATHGENIPELTLRLMQRLSSRSESTPDLDAAIAREDAPEKVRVLFGKEELERFVPPGYRKTLMTILATDSLPVEELDALNDLRDTLDADRLETKIADIITEIMLVIPLEEQGDGIRRNLADLTTYFLNNADFNSLARICRILFDSDEASGEHTFIDPGFIQKILDAPSFLGRENYRGIRSIITTVGRPFVSPLIDRMANEEDRGLRRFWFDCLGELGEMVRDVAMERINDTRWYLVRNLLILLRTFNDDEVKLQVRRLARHHHPRIRSEAIKNLIYYQDPTADRLILHEIDSADPARRLAAVQNAELSCNPEVIGRLIAILETGSFKEYTLEVKCAAVQSLAACATVQALPGFIRILRSTSLFNLVRLNQLKIEIIRVLPLFPADQVCPVLRELAASGGKTIAPIAAKALKGFKECTP